MIDSIAVTGLGLITPLGVGSDAVWDSFASGRSGIRELASDDPRIASRIDPTPLPPVRRAGFVSGFEPREHVHSPYLRRMDWCSRMLVAAARQALDDANAAPLDEPARAAIVVGSLFGSQREGATFMKRVIEVGPAAAQPLLFPNLVLNAPAGYAAIELGIQGPNLSVSQHEASGEAAIATAVDLLSSGACDLVIAGGVDEFGSIYLGALRERRLLDPESVPLDEQRKRAGKRGAIIPGEGAAVLVLETAARARARKAKLRARILAVGNGAVRATSYAFPEPNEAAAAMLELLSREHTESISGMIGGADGTKPRDQLDRALLELLSRRTGAPVGYVPVKRLVGDFGSGGVLAAALAVLAVERGALPTLDAREGSSLLRDPRSILIPGAARGGALLPVLIGRADEPS